MAPNVKGMTIVMSLNWQIDEAIKAHCAWGQRLISVIHTGEFDPGFDSAARDDACAFGKWLYGPSIPPAAKALPGYQEVVDIHAKFHGLAAQIVALIKTGQKAEALNRLSITSDYSTASISLTLALREWQADALKPNDGAPAK